MARVRISGSLIGGKFSSWVEDQKRILGLAVREGVDAAATGFVLDLRQQIDAAGYSPKIGNMIRSRTFPPKGIGSLGAAANVFAAGAGAERILLAAANGPTIVPGKGAHLAIPTQFNRQGGRRGAALAVTPQQMIASRKAFTVPAGAGGNLAWCLRVAATRSDRGKLRALAGGLREIGGGRRKRVQALIDKGFVPMFWLVKAAKMRKVLDLDGTAAKWADQIPDLIERALPGDL